MVGVTGGLEWVGVVVMVGDMVDGGGRGVRYNGQSCRVEVSLSWEPTYTLTASLYRLSYGYLSQCVQSVSHIIIVSVYLIRIFFFFLSPNVSLFRFISGIGCCRKIFSFFFSTNARGIVRVFKNKISFFFCTNSVGKKKKERNGTGKAKQQG